MELYCQQTNRTARLTDAQIVMLNKVVITTLYTVVLYTKVGIVLENIITYTQLSMRLLQRELTQKTRVYLLTEIIIPHVMLTKVLTHIEGRGRTMEESRRSQLNSISQEWETKVGMPIHMYLSGTTTCHPRLGTHVIMEGLTLCLQQLTTHRHVVLVPCLLTII